MLLAQAQVQECVWKVVAQNVKAQVQEQDRGELPFSLGIMNISG